MKIWMIVAAVVTAFVLGLATGFGLYSPKPVPSSASYAPEKRQSDGSLVVERKPMPKPPSPRHVVPDGYEVDRVITATVQTKSELVDLDISLVSGSDGQRVIISSPQGEVVKAVDIPAAKTERKLVWAAGLIYNPMSKEIGGFVDRDLGPLRLGLDVTRGRHPSGFREIQTTLRAGIRF